MSDNHGYQIDYDHVDVTRLMQQVRARAASRHAQEPAALTVDSPDLLQRLRDSVDLDDEQPYELQRALRLGGNWNIAPADLRASHDGLLGTLISAVRRLLHPLVKVLVNLDSPLHKQFKINLGMANAIHELRLENDALRRRILELSTRVDELAERNDRASTGGPC